MKIQIMGTGCPKCKMLMKNADKAVKELGIQAEISKVDKIQAIAKVRVMMTPALAIDGTVKSARKVLSSDDTKKLLA